MNTHSIQSQVFELSAAGGKTALQWESIASKFQHDIILKVIEDCFDSLPLTGQHLIIDRLEIDLGVFSMETFMNEGRQRLIDQLIPMLKKAQTETAVPTNEVLNKKHYFINDHYASQQERRRDGDDVKNVQSVVVDSSTALFSALVYFVQQGRFPWWFNTSQRIDDINLQFSTAWFITLSDFEKDHFRQILYTDNQALIRVVNQFSVKWLAEVFESIGLSGKEALIFWKLFVTVSESFRTMLSVFKQNFWALWVVKIKDNKPCLDVLGFIASTAAGNNQLNRDLTQTLQDVCLDSIAKAKFADQSKRVLESLGNFFAAKDGHNYKGYVGKAMSTYPKGTQKDARYNDRKEPAIQKLSINDLLKSDGTSLTPKQQGEIEGRFLNSIEKVTSSVDYLSTDTTNFVRAAGLVLLHPFLVELFDSTCLLTRGQWVSDEAHHRAIKLLCFLSFGNEDVPECDLLFHKILVNMAIDTPLMAIPALTQTEKETCNELLLAVISHWKSLRKTSVDGLREAFIQRAGKLTTTDNGYKLLVERKTHDVLLPGIPWGYATIKFPWTNKILFVEWI